MKTQILPNLSARQKPATAKACRFLPVVAAALFAGFLNVSAAAANTQGDPAVVRQASFGDVTVLLPSIEGYQEIYKRTKEFDDFMEQFVPPTNTLLAVYLSDADMARIADSKNLVFKDYILVQTVKQDVTLPTDADFAALKETFRKEIDSMTPSESAEVKEIMDKVSDYVSSNYQTDLNVKVGEVKSLGVASEDNRHISFLTLANYGVNTGEGEKSHMVASSMTGANVQGRLIYTYVYLSDFKDEADLEHVKKSTSAYVKNLFDINTPKAAAGASNARYIVGGLCGLLAVIIAVALIRRRKVSA